jgi:hypothetical protein
LLACSPRAPGGATVRPTPSTRSCQAYELSFYPFFDGIAFEGKFNLGMEFTSTAAALRKSRGGSAAGRAVDRPGATSEPQHQRVNHATPVHALELPEAIRLHLSLIRAPSRASVEAENMHITLRFAGDIDERTADDFAGRLRDIKAEPWR